MHFEVFAQVPGTILLVVLNTLIFVRSFHGIQDHSKDWCLSLHDIVRKCQWKRIFTFSLVHGTIYHFIVSVLCLWSVRKVELLLGTFYFLRYSLLFVLVEGLGIISLLYLAQSYGLSFSALQGMKVTGCSGLVMSWTAFLGLVATFHHGDSMSEKLGLFHVFGIIPVSWYLAPLILLTLAPLLLPREAVLCNAVGYVNGYLLYFGFIKILPDVYWTACFLANIAMFLTTLSLDPVHANTSDGQQGTRLSEYDLNRFGLFIGFRGIAEGDTIPVYVPAAQVETASSSLESERTSAELNQLEEGRGRRRGRGDNDDDDDDEEIKAGDEEFFVGRPQHPHPHPSSSSWMEDRDQEHEERRPLLSSSKSFNQPPPRPTSHNHNNHHNNNNNSVITSSPARVSTRLSSSFQAGLDGNNASGPQTTGLSELDRARVWEQSIADTVKIAARRRQQSGAGGGGGGGGGSGGNDDSGHNDNL